MGNQQSLRILIERGDWEDVRWMLENDETARTRAGSKEYIFMGDGAWEQGTSLHLAILQSPPTDVVRTFLRINRDLAVAKSKPSGESPTHKAVQCAARGGPAVGVALKVLLDTCPEAVSPCTHPRYGSRTPLHLACALRVHPSIVALLRDADPYAATMARDGEGKTALDIVEAHKDSLMFSRLWKRKVKVILDVNITTNTTNAEPNELVPALISEDDDDVNVNEDETIGDGAEDIPAGEDICVVCYDGRASHIVVPCGHLCLCARCSSKQIFQGSMHNQCPVCKQQAEQAMKVYRSGAPNPGGALLDLKSAKSTN